MSDTSNDMSRQAGAFVIRQHTKTRDTASSQRVCNKLPSTHIYTYIYIRGISPHSRGFVNPTQGSPHALHVFLASGTEESFELCYAQSAYAAKRRRSRVGLRVGQASTFRKKGLSPSREAPAYSIITYSLSYAQTTKLSVLTLGGS
jgi:hypothetical protein